MITLATLPQATAQEVFDQVATHLLTQGVKCADEEGTCQYRMEGGLKCAAGCLIGDDEYNPDWEGHGWVFVAKEEKLMLHHEKLIDKLQGIHDSENVEDWVSCLSDVALNRGLAVPPLLQQKLQEQGGLD